MIRGEMSFDSGLIGDFIIVKSDTYPTYNYASPVDDATMNITHVIRGEEHLSNTPYQLMVIDALGYARPEAYAHMPLILANDGSKMSKRKHPELNLLLYREQGYLPEALINYLVLLGWNPGTSQEIFSFDELVRIFSFDRVQHGGARFDWDKLNWINGEYIREMSDERFYEQSVHALARVGLDTNQFPAEYVKAALDTCRGKIKTFAELPAYAGFYFREELTYEPEAAQKAFVPENKPRLEKLRDTFGKLVSFDAAAIEAALKTTATELGVKVGVLIHPTRLACTGNPHGPSLYHLIEVLGKERVMARIEKTLGNPSFIE